MKGYKELYRSEISKLLGCYNMGGMLNEFLGNIIHIWFGVEQIKREFEPFDYKFYCKNQVFLREFIRTLRKISEDCDDVFRVLKYNDCYMISCKRKDFKCKQIQIYSGSFKNYDDFFESVDFKYDFNYLAYDYKKDELYAQNLDLLNDRLEKYNVESHELDWFKEIFCESGGGEWASYNNL
jgi:hypothetical protein